MSDQVDIGRLTRARLRELQQLRSTRGRRDQQRFLLDGEKLVRDAVEADAPLTELLSTDPDHWSDAALPLTKLSSADAERLSDTKTPQGHFAICRDELTAFEMPTGDRWHVVALDAVQDAGNVGGIIRSAAAFGADAVLVGTGSADPTHPRVLRAATGAWFRTSIARADSLPEQLQALREHGIRILAADTDAQPLDEADIPQRAVWLFGNEGAGISEELAPLIDQRVSIPIADGVDSLNVNVAAGIILHHLQRASQERTVERSTA